MDIDKHTPSLAHLRAFALSRSKGRPTHVAQDRQQVAAPADNRIFAFAYEKFLSAVIEYVDDGCHGRAIERAVANASSRMQPSYTVAAEGISRVLGELDPNSVSRRQRNVLVSDEEGLELVSLRVHLLFNLPNGSRIGALMYFSPHTLTPIEFAIMDTAVALAVRAIDADATPAIIMVRAGVIRFIDPREAEDAIHVETLRRVSEAYRAEWIASA